MGWASVSYLRVKVLPSLLPFKESIRTSIHRFKELMRASVDFGERTNAREEAMRTSVMRLTLGCVLGCVLAVLFSPLPAAAQTAPALQVSVGHAPEPAEVGSDVSFAALVTNDGPGDATGVQVVVRFPDADAVFASVRSAEGLCSETAPGEVSCDMGTLAEGAAASAQVVVTPVTASALPASAEADSAEGANAPGSDSATVTGEDCDVVGTQGDDTLTALSPGDVVCGLGGDDGLTGVDGDETLYGGTGDDTLAGGLGNDLLDGGNGRDEATFAGATEGVGADLTAGTATVGTETDSLVGIDDLTGSVFNDSVRGSAGPNRISGGDGLDLLWGGDGVDTILGDGADDYLNGGAGADALDGGPGANTCAEEEGTVTACRLDSPRDPDDAKGRLDLWRIRTSFGATQSSWFFNTQRAWTVNDIWDEGYALVFLDTSGNASAEYRILIRARTSGRGVSAFLTRLGDGTRWGLEAWRPGSSSLAVRLPMSRLSIGSGRTYFRWWGQTLSSHSFCKRAVCFDLAPGQPSTGTLIQPVL
jgi:Ca2+-binding RTX toxin-like protein